MRLIAGQAEGGILRAGLVVVLDPGWKTYWRTPGESGLPPSFDWSASQNVERVEVGWPAPTRLAEANGVSYGYEGRVVLPLRVAVRDPARPVRLALRFEFGTCRDLCVPEAADLSLVPPIAPDPAQDAAIRTAEAAVPRRAPLGDAGRTSILRLEPVAGGERLDVVVRANGTAALFVEAPAPWFLLADAAPPSDAATGERTVSVAILERPPEAEPVTLDLTLVGQDGAVETSVRLDASPGPR